MINDTKEATALGEAQELPKGGRPRSYDWDHLLVPGNCFVLKLGRDFDCSVSGIRQQIRNAASQRRVRTRITPGRDGELIVIVEASTRALVRQMTK